MPKPIEVIETPELKENESLQKFNSVDDLAKSYLEIESYKGKFASRGVLIPDDKSSPEEVATYRKRMGIPEKAEEYKLSQLQNLHPNIKITPEGTKPFLDFAHKAGFSNAQVDLINQWYLSQVDSYYKAQDLQAQNQAKVDAENLVKLQTDLKTKWGVDYDKKIALAKKLVQLRGGENLGKALGSALENPAVLEFLANEGAKYTEDDFTNIGVSTLTGEKAELKKFIDATNTNGTEENKILMDNAHPKHNEYLERRTKAYEVVYGGEQ